MGRLTNNVAVIGAGPAGLATSLFLARRGHRVTLVEKDADPPPNDPEACFRDWTRRGVAQARQPHVLLARASMVLRAEAPDVLDALAEAGARFVTNTLEHVDPHRSVGADAILNCWAQLLDGTVSPADGLVPAFC